MKTIRILIADDQTIVRVGIHQLVAQLPHVEIIGEATDGQAALENVKILQPDLVLMDIEMPELNGLEATAQIVRDFPNVKVIILSSYATENHVIQAIRAGAKGYIPKNSRTIDLELAIRLVANNQTYLSPAISQQFLNLVRAAGHGDKTIVQLSSRQQEILRLIAEGKTVKEIAFLLNISPKTVETHRAQLIAKLHIHHVPGLVRYAIRTGLVRPEPCPEFGTSFMTAV